MGKGTVLRVAPDINLTPNLVKNLNALLQEPEITDFDQERNLSDSYSKRADSLTHALLFIIEAYPPNANQKAFEDHALLTKYIKACRQNVHFDDRSLDKLQGKLNGFTSYLINVLMDGWQFTKNNELNEAIACLNEAEQYVLMREGAKDVATLHAMDFNEEEHLILQWDKRLQPYSEQWLSELKTIQAQQAPTTPAWFKDLQAAQQVYFAYSKNDQNPKLNCNHFYLKWLEQTKNTVELQQDLQAIKENQNKPGWFLELKGNAQEMLQEILAAEKTISIEKITQSLYALNEKSSSVNPEDLNQISSLPLWYWLLSETQQHFLGHTLKNANAIEEVVSFLPSRLRTLPAPANFRSHQLFILDDEGAIEKQFEERLASSHIASRDVLKHPQKVQKLHTTTNLDAVLKYKAPGKPVIIQTLISPAPILNYVPQYLADVPPDYELSLTLKEAVDSMPMKADITHVNHPFNIAKRFYYTPSTETGCLQLLEMAKAHFEKDNPFLALAEKYENVLKSGFGSATLYDWNGRELFLSSYEHLLIVGLEGLSYGSCVSGKDRKSIEFIHTDAMLIYKECYGRWPTIDDSQGKRQAFINIVVALYCTRHAHELAGQNAPGSEGIKTPEHYWPADISAAIKARMGENGLKEDDRLATNNEVKRISPSFNKTIEPGRILTRLVALNIGEADCQKLIDNLALVLNETQRFLVEARYNLFSSEPRGISEIKALIKSHIESLENGAENTSQSSSICIVSRILNIIHERPKTPGNRTDATQKVYQLLLGLIEDPSMAENTNNELHKLKIAWYKLNETTQNGEMKRVSSSPNMTYPS